MKLQLDEKKSKIKEKPYKVNKLILKTKADLKEELITYNSHPWITFSLN